MATGRTAEGWLRVFVDGYDFSGQARKVGPLSIEYDAADLTAIADPVKCFYPGHPNVNVGAINSVFSGQFTQVEYTVADDGGGLVVNLPFTGWASDAVSLGYATPWGVLLNANTARTAVNTATGVDLINVSTAKGGYM